MLIGFFVGWPNPPSPEAHLRVLHRSAHVQLAIDDTAGRVVGFVTAISDGVLSAYIPLVEVLPEYQHQGIGTELIHRMIARLQHLYMIDTLSEDDVTSFYERVGMERAAGMMIRNYQNQSSVSTGRGPVTPKDNESSH
jgi:ribosomal protein S18 acetylase RimI-like enzyme